MTLRAPEPADGARMYELVRTEGGLELNSAYAYIMLCKRFRDQCVLAEADDALAGFVLGVVAPSTPDTLFVWQVGVCAAFRGRGIAARMLDVLVARLRPRYVEAHVAIGNEPSERLFRALGRRHGVPVDVKPGLMAQWFPEAHADERLFRVGPLSSGP